MLFVIPILPLSRLTIFTHNSLAATLSRILPTHRVMNPTSNNKLVPRRHAKPSATRVRSQSLSITTQNNIVTADLAGTPPRTTLQLHSRVCKRRSASHQLQRRSGTCRDPKTDSVFSRTPQVTRSQPLWPLHTLVKWRRVLATRHPSCRQNQDHSATPGQELTATCGRTPSKNFWHALEDGHVSTRRPSRKI